MIIVATHGYAFHVKSIPGNKKNIALVLTIEVLHDSHIGWQNNENYLH